MGNADRIEPFELPGIDHMGIEAHPVKLICSAGTANAAVGIIGEKAGAGIQIHQENGSGLRLQSKGRTSEVPQGAGFGLDLELIDLVIQVGSPFRKDLLEPNIAGHLPRKTDGPPIQNASFVVFHYTVLTHFDLLI
jgi:hypothetical protein